MRGRGRGRGDGGTPAGPAAAGGGDGGTPAGPAGAAAAAGGGDGDTPAGPAAAGGGDGGTPAGPAAGDGGPDAGIRARDMDLWVEPVELDNGKYVYRLCPRPEDDQETPQDGPRRIHQIRLRITGVDPGCGAHLFHATVVGMGPLGCTRQPEVPPGRFVVKVSTDNHRTARGLRRQRRDLQQRQQRHHSALQTQQATLTGMPTNVRQPRVLTPQACAARSATGMGAMADVYACRAHRTGQLRVHIMTAREYDRVCQQLAFGESTAKGKWARRFERVLRSSKTKHLLRRAIANKAMPLVSVVGMGDAAAGHGSSVPRPHTAPVARILELLTSRYHNVYIMLIDEHRTSKTCSRCGDPANNLVTVGRRGTNHFLRRCKQCCLVKHACSHHPQRHAPSDMDTDSGSDSSSEGQHDDDEEEDEEDEEDEDEEDEEDEEDDDDDDDDDDEDWVPERATVQEGGDSAAEAEAEAGDTSAGTSKAIAGLIVQRDVNASRNICVKAICEIFPDGNISDLQKINKAMDRRTRKATRQKGQAQPDAAPAAAQPDSAAAPAVAQPDAD
jgi:Bone sialoprotein II (BSP-II)